MPGQKTTRIALFQQPAGPDHLLLADLDLAAAAESHARRLFLRDRRPALYPGWLGPRPAPQA